MLLLVWKHLPWEGRGLSSRGGSSSSSIYSSMFIWSEEERFKNNQFETSSHQATCAFLKNTFSHTHTQQLSHSSYCRDTDVRSSCKTPQITFTMNQDLFIDGCEWSRAAVLSSHVRWQQLLKPPRIYSPAHADFPKDDGRNIYRRVNKREQRIKGSSEI